MRAYYLRPLHAAAVLLILLLGGWGIAAQAQIGQQRAASRSLAARAAYRRGDHDRL